MKSSLCTTLCCGELERDYRQTLTNAVVAFRRLSTNDFGDDPKVWIKAYGYGPEPDGPEGANRVAKFS